MIGKTKFFAGLVGLVLLVLVAGCKDDDPQPAFEYQTQGFIKGKFTGVSKDNSYTFNEDFNYSQYSILFGGFAEYEINDDGSYSVQLYRANFASLGAATIRFELDNATDTTPDNVIISFEYNKELNDKFLTFTMESDFDNTTTVTDLTFDSGTGRFKGKFSLTGADNSSGKNASVTGEFDLIAKRPVQ
ncbi:hypothetical protein [Chryseolinea sp. H1M3-3]|uniref:hypothetical protein n=1 Tax=Chryseolinea sp. H1M3-3 TaxID=3034144 RepID=UPI0023EE1722|nr:hypothetical protein [Chryseolinea sp. H1M3-3]